MQKIKVTTSFSLGVDHEILYQALGLSMPRCQSSESYEAPNYFTAHTLERQTTFVERPQ